MGHFMVPMQVAPSSTSVPNLKWIAHFVQKLLGAPKFRNWVTWPRPRQFRGHFILHTQTGSVLHLCTKFEADYSIRSIVIKGVTKLGNWVTWPRPRPLSGRFMVHTLGPGDASLPFLPTNPAWWGLMHVISSYRGSRPTNTQTNTHTHRQDLLQYTAPLVSPLRVFESLSSPQCGCIAVIASQ